MRTSPRLWCPLSVVASLALMVAWMVAPAVSQDGDSPSPEPSLRDRVGRGMAVTDSIRRTGDRDGALAHLEALRAEAQSVSDSVSLLDAMRLQSFWMRKLGQVSLAIQTGEQAVELAEALRDTSKICGELYKLGLAVSGVGELERADGYFARVMDVAAARGDVAYQARARTALGRRALFKGDKELALEHLEWASAMTRKEGMGHDEVMALNILGMAWSGQGKFDNARACFDRCVVLSRELDYPYGLMQGVANLAYLENHLGDPSAAAEGYRTSYELAQEMGQVDNVFSSGSNYASSLLQVGRHDDAEKLLTELLESARESGQHPEQECNVRIHLAAVMQSRDRHAPALEQLERAAELSEALEYVEGEVRVVRRMAAAHAGQGDADRARRLLLDRDEDLSRRALPTQYLPMAEYLCDLLIQNDEHPEALRRLREIERRSLEIGHRGILLTALAGRAKCHNALGEPDSATAVLERATRLWEQERSAPRDPEWREQRGSLGRQIYTDYAQLLMVHPESESADTRVRRAFDVVQRYKARTLWERMMGPAVEVVEEAYEPPDLGSIQRELQAGELLLDVYTGPTHSLLFAVTSSSIRAVELGSGPEIATKLDLFRELLVDPSTDERALAVAGSAVGKLLFEELADEISRADRILFVPDGHLHEVPLASLRDGADPGSELLLDGKEIQRVPSVAILSRLRRDEEIARPGEGPDIVAVAGGSNDAGQLLEGALREVTNLFRSFERVESHVGVLPDEGMLSRGQVLHLAAHTRVDDQRPWRSGMLLASSAPTYLESISTQVAGVGLDVLRRANADDGPSERYLQASEIAGLDLRAQLAVLSGCESAGGRILLGEGVQGLAHAFLSAQVSSVIATLWPLDDASADRFMEFFYDALADGETIASALQNAQTSMRGEPDRAHPFYWAGYVLIGDGSGTIPLERKPDMDLRRGIAGGFVILVLAVLVWRRTRPNPIAS